MPDKRRAYLSIIASSLTGASPRQVWRVCSAVAKKIRGAPSEKDAVIDGTAG
jgi:hypothetical protein